VLKACNLGDRVVKELDFLACVESMGDVLFAPSVVKLAILRYEHLWLPVLQHALEALNPPLDIALMQHCHLLSPTRCATLCEYTAKSNRCFAVQSTSPVWHLDVHVKVLISQSQTCSLWFATI
jgi:hypothetical protein